MSEAFLFAARRLVANGQSDTDAHLIEAAHAILHNGAKRPIGQDGIARMGGPCPADEYVILRIWPERASPADPNGPEFSPRSTPPPIPYIRRGVRANAAPFPLPEGHQTWLYGLTTRVTRPKPGHRGTLHAPTSPARRRDVAFRISEKDVDRYPGPREKLEAARAARPPAAKPRRPWKEKGESSAAYVECDVDQEAAGAWHWVLELPDLEFINANEVRGWHWTRERKTAAAIRAAAAKAATDARVPRLARPRVLYLVHPSARTRVFDLSNWALSAKAAVDGLSDAGVWADDNAAVVTGVDPRAVKRGESVNIRMSLVVIDQGGAAV